MVVSPLQAKVTMRARSARGGAEQTTPEGDDAGT